MFQIPARLLAPLIVATGRRLIELASKGRWRGESFSGREGRIYGAAGALSFVRDGQRVLTRDGMMLIGIVFYITLFIGVMFVWQTLSLIHTAYLLCGLAIFFNLQYLRYFLLHRRQENDFHSKKKLFYEKASRMSAVVFFAFCLILIIARSSA